MKDFEVAELVGVLRHSYPNARITKETCVIYEKMLADLDHEASNRAVARLVSTSKWLPTIAEIRAAVVEMQAGARRFGGEAWGDINEAVRRVGRYGSPKFEDPLVGECARMMGWEALCNSTNDTADRARFIELYDNLATRERRNAVAGDHLSLPSPNDRRGQLRAVSDIKEFSSIGKAGIK